MLLQLPHERGVPKPDRALEHLQLLRQPHGEAGGQPLVVVVFRRHAGDPLETPGWVEYVHHVGTPNLKPTTALTQDSVEGQGRRAMAASGIEVDQFDGLGHATTIVQALRDGFVAGGHDTACTN